MLTINQERFLNLMSEQAKFGATEEGGVSRPALSEFDIEIRNWFNEMVEADGLDYAIDGAGNQTATLKSKNKNAKTLVIGSHFDSVPNGGRYDGALGVIAAYESLLSIKDAEIELPFHLSVINFTDEEGTLMGLTGSKAFIGKLEKEHLLNPRGGRDHLLESLSRAGLTEESIVSAKCDPESLEGYIEVHIEQGTRLEEAGIEIGVVTSIVGIRSYWMTFRGEAAHAGTKPMDKRKDAFWGAADFALCAKNAVIADFHPGVVNFGRISVQPSAFNIVPSEARIAVEFRHGDPEQLDAMETLLMKQAQLSADEYGLDVEFEEGHGIIPAPMTEKYVSAIETACDKLELSHTRLLSFAGHDAQSLASVTNSVMFFVPSVDGISHNPREFTKDEDCINAANVMLQTVLTLASS